MKLDLVPLLAVTAALTLVAWILYNVYDELVRIVRTIQFPL